MTDIGLFHKCTCQSQTPLSLQRPEAGYTPIPHTFSCPALPLCGLKHQLIPVVTPEIGLHPEFLWGGSAEKAKL